MVIKNDSITLSPREFIGLVRAIAATETADFHRMGNEVEGMTKAGFIPSPDVTAAAEFPVAMSGSLNEMRRVHHALTVALLMANLPKP
jgi:hypothetical protein